VKCDVGGVTNYSDCEECKATVFNLVIGTHKYCQDYCPTGFGSSLPDCTAPADFEVFAGVFNKFDNTWTTATVTATG
jgi:hypothetical protein